MIRDFTGMGMLMLMFMALVKWVVNMRVRLIVRCMEVAVVVGMMLMTVA
jgi:hypothetical protein